MERNIEYLQTPVSNFSAVSQSVIDGLKSLAEQDYAVVNGQRFLPIKCRKRLFAEMEDSTESKATSNGLSNTSSLEVISPNSSSPVVITDLDAMMYEASTDSEPEPVQEEPLGLSPCQRTPPEKNLDILPCKECLEPVQEKPLDLSTRQRSPLEQDMDILPCLCEQCLDMEQ